MFSLLDIFKVGIGPSSSHTVGPMVAASDFARGLGPALGAVAQVRVTLFGSLAWTGEGHGTDRAVILGLAGQRPDTVEPEIAAALLAGAYGSKTIALAGATPIRFDPTADIVFDRLTQPPRHPNTMQFEAFDAAGERLACARLCSVGGGFVMAEDAPSSAETGPPLPYPFRSAEDLLRLAAASGLSIPALIRANETARHGADAAEAHADRVIETMMHSIDRGLAADGELPGRLRVRRRARQLARRLEADRGSNVMPPVPAMDWVSVYAIAVNEENAAGGRIVTAPTNGAAGVVPAVLRYFRDTIPGATQEAMRDFLFAGTAIASLFKLNASISGAEVGCQGEVGVASSMAAAGLAAALGAEADIIENAAEIAMEHHLGMTCDPVGGLVQIPCIERNAFGAVKAINAAMLAIRGEGVHHVTLDQVIATMRQTGADMQSKYKETSLGGLAVNFVEC